MVRSPTMTGRGARGDRRARRRPAAGRLAADRRVRASTTAGRARCWPRTSTRSRSSAQGYPGPFKIQVAGPWTLAATVEKPRGDKVLSDHGARREPGRRRWPRGCATHVADVRRRLPDATELIVQLDEPALPAVLAGTGAHRVRFRPAPDGPSARGLRGAGVGLRPRSWSAGGVPIVHCCARRRTRRARCAAPAARGLSVDLARSPRRRTTDWPRRSTRGSGCCSAWCRPCSPSARRPTVRSPSRCSAGSTCSASNRPTTLVLTPACGLAGRHRPGPGRRWSRRQGSRATSPDRSVGQDLRRSDPRRGARPCTAPAAGAPGRAR